MLTIDTKDTNQLEMLRVHIAPVGFEVDRIVLPAKKMRADRVWLVVHSKKAEDMGTPFKEAIEQQLREARIECKFQEANRTDLFDTLAALREIILKEKGNALFVNVSVGSKIQAIASTMVCMMFRDTAMIKMYYAVPDRYTTQPRKQETEGLREVFMLPDYKIEKPDNNLVACLALIGERKGGRISKKELKDLAIENALIHIDEKTEHPEQAGYMALNKNLIEPLLKWKFIRVEKSGPRHIVYLTADGINALKFLGPGNMVENKR
jgi:hypothetical protein